MKIGIAIAALAVMMTAGGTHAEPAGKREIYRTLNYDMTEQRHGADDDRTILVQIGLMNGDYARFSYQEYVRGATTPTVKAVRYENASDIEISGAQMDALLKALGDAGIGSLKSDDYSNTNYTANFHFTFGNRSKDLHFTSPPTEGTRMAVYKVLFDFVHQLDIDRPRQPDVATVSEGDRVPAMTVALADILAHPETYDGKRVRVVGYYHGEYEGMTFCIDKTAVTTNRYDKCFWRDDASTFANPADIDFANNRWETVEGVFFKGPAGHFGMWPGKIERLTLVRPLVPSARTPAK